MNKKQIETVKKEINRQSTLWLIRSKKACRIVDIMETKSVSPSYRSYVVATYTFEHNVYTILTTPSKIVSIERLLSNMWIIVSCNEITYETRQLYTKWQHNFNSLIII